MNSTFDPSVFHSIPPANRPLLFARQGFALHAMVTGVGYEHREESSYDHHGLKRGRLGKFSLFQYTLSGEGRLRYEDTEHTIRPGTAMLLHFPHNHRYWLPHGKYWNFFYLLLNGCDVVRTFQFANKHIGPLLPLTPNDPLLEIAGRTCIDLLNRKLKTPWVVSQAAYGIAMQLLEHAKPASSGDNVEQPAAIARAVAFCKNHLADPIGVEDLARAARLSRCYFTRLFQSNEGISPGEYITQRRQRQAADLLRNTKEPIRSIALQCGYSDASYFCKIFRKTFGVSPSALRHGDMF